MKTQYVHDVIAHLIDGRPFGGSTPLWTDGEYLYSYNTAVGSYRFLSDEHAGVLFLSSDSLSRTTSRWVNAASNAMIGMDGEVEWIRGVTRGMTGAEFCALVDEHEAPPKATEAEIMAYIAKRFPEVVESCNRPR